MTTHSLTARALVAYSILQADRETRGWRSADPDAATKLADKLATESPDKMVDSIMALHMAHQDAVSLSYAIKEAWLGLSPLEPVEAVKTPFRGMSPRAARVYDILCAELGNRFWSQDELREAAEQIGDADPIDVREAFNLSLNSHECWDDLRDKIEEAIRLDIIDRQQAALELYAD